MVADRTRAVLRFPFGDATDEGSNHSVIVKLAATDFLERSLPRVVQQLLAVVLVQIRSPEHSTNATLTMVHELGFGSPITRDDPRDDTARELRFVRLHARLMSVGRVDPQLPARGIDGLRS